MATSNAYSIASIELNHLTEFQKRIHALIPKSKNNRDLKFDNKAEENFYNDEEAHSRFRYEILKPGWSVHIREEIKQEMKGDIFSYRPNGKFSFLLFTELKTLLPALEIKDEYKESYIESKHDPNDKTTDRKPRIEMCWPNNLFHNIIIEGILTTDDDIPIQRLDSVWLDIVSGFYMKSGPGKAGLYDQMIGNIPFLTDWSTELKSYPILCPQPWYYAAHTKKALPLVYHQSLSSVTHQYKFRNNIENLIRMRAKAGPNGEWKEFKFNKSYVYEVDKEDMTLKIGMDGMYSEVGESEKEFHKTNGHHTYYGDVISIDTTNKYSLGEPIVQPIQGDSPVKAIFWMAENSIARSVNNYSNYTTDPSKVEFGWNPVSFTEIKHGELSRDKIPSYQSDRSEPWHYFPSFPKDPGYNAISIGYATWSPIAVDVGIVLAKKFNNTTINVQLGETHPRSYHRKNEDIPELANGNIKIKELQPITSSRHKNKNKKKDRYFLRTRLYVTREITFSMKGIKVTSAGTG